MISVNNVSMHFAARLLFDDVNLSLLPNKRYGLVGANGTGKSTFLRLLARDDTPSLGEILIPKQASVGWLKQDQFRYENDSVVAVVIQGKPKLWKALQEKEQILENIADIDEKAGMRLGEIEEIIFHQNGYTAETFAQSLLIGLGVPQQYHFKPLNNLSGGFKLRVLLAQTLFEEPDILLLDEPTNHLDIMSISWLEGYLKNEYKGVLLYISHDHDFLNNLSTHILDVDYGEIREYVGNFDKFIEEKKLHMEQKMHELKYVENKIAHMRVFVERFRASASRSRQALSREKAIDKLELPDIKKSSRISPNFNFKQKRPPGKKVIEVTGLSKQFADKVVLKNVSFTMHRGEKLAIIGHNGIGKSTLLKILLEIHKPDSGHYEWGYESQISYFAQDHHETLHGNMTVFDWLKNERENDTTQENIRKALGMMLFTQDDVHKNIQIISGGEAARLLFANIMLQNANILILDEPTNHLDLESREALASALSKYEGTVIVVSHDRHFVSGIATRVLALTDNKIIDFQGTYPEYLKQYGEDYLNKAWMVENEKQK